MANRQLAILRYLRRGKISVSEIAEKVEAGKRTVERDLLDLSGDYCIHSKCGNGGGVWLEPAAIVGQDILSIEEVAYIIEKLAEVQNKNNFLHDSIMEKLSPLMEIIKKRQ